MSAERPSTFDRIKAQHDWRPIPGCAGRYVLDKCAQTPQELLGWDAAVDRLVTAGARDPVVVVRFPDGGGLISYEHVDGFVHTLNTAEGLRRKLVALGAAAPCEQD